MKQMIAFCGLNCSECPMYIATQNDDDNARAESAAMLKKAYGLEFKPEEMDATQKMADFWAIAMIAKSELVEWKKRLIIVHIVKTSLVKTFQNFTDYLPMLKQLLRRF